jgi:hypothetical protein
MTDIDKRKIATSFPDKFDQTTLAIEISPSEFKIFENGIFATSMDDKWNVFVLDKVLYLARSWTNFCIYRVFTQQQDEKVILSDFQVNRNENQYRSKDIEYDTVLLKKLLQMFLQREDFYSDPKLELPLIKATLETVDPNNECKKSIGLNDVGLTKQIHDGLTSIDQKKYCDVIGWTELRSKILNKSDAEPLVSLYVQNRQTNSAVTYYFDKDVKELLGQIIIKRRLSSS